MVSSSVFKELNFDSFFPLRARRSEEEEEEEEEGDFPTCQTKNVMFVERVKVVEIPSLKHLTKKEKKVLWYSDPGESFMKRSRMRQLLCGMEDRDDSNDVADDEYDFGFSRSEERMRLPVSAVLAEQRSQRELGIEDPEFISKIYKQCSAHSTMKAQIRAMQSEEEARKEYIATRRKSKTIFQRIRER